MNTRLRGLSFRWLMLAAWIGLMTGATPALLAQEKKPATLPAETVAAWEKAGAKAGWMRPGTCDHASDSLSFYTNRAGQDSLWEEVVGAPTAEEKAAELPAFRFSEWQPGMLGSLILMRAPVTDAGLTGIGRLKSLQTLDLRWTQVSDAGMKSLEGLKSLRSLDLVGTRVTNRGLSRLKKAHPGIAIVQ